jgi:hypothetical protein
LPAAVVAVLLTPLSGWAVSLIGLALVAVVTAKLVRPPAPVPARGA